MGLLHPHSSLDVPRALLATLAGAFAVATGGCEPAAAPLEWNDAVVSEIEAWRTQHEESYTRNWATIEGLHFLEPGTQSAGSAPDSDRKRRTTTREKNFWPGPNRYAFCCSTSTGC